MPTDPRRVPSPPRSLARISFAIVVVAAPFPVVAARTCALSQVTQTASGFNSVPALSADGRFVAFSSRANLTGENPSGLRQIFLFELATSMVDQITSIAVAGRAADSPSVDATGDRVAFHSNADLTGGNADGGIEVFVFDRSAGAVVQLTSSANAADYAALPSIRDDGLLVAWSGTVLPSGTNPDGNEEVWTTALSAASPPVVGASNRVTDGPAASVDPSLSPAGTYVLFDSEGNLAGDNGDGSFELFLHDRGLAQLEQLSDSSSDSGTGSMNTGFVLLANNGRHLSADDDVAVFHSYGDLTGGNPGHVDKVFAHRRSEALTTQLGGGTTPTIDAAGRRVALQSTDFSTVLEIAIADLVDGGLTRITTSVDAPPKGSYQPSISADGSVVAFRSEADLLGTNPELNSEVFVARCWLFADSFESQGTCGWSASIGAPPCS